MRPMVLSTICRPVSCQSLCVRRAADHLPFMCEPRLIPRKLGEDPTLDDVFFVSDQAPDHRGSTLAEVLGNKCVTVPNRTLHEEYKMPGPLTT
jgi:hypothetical protein